MTTASEEKWAKAQSAMTADLRPILKLLKADYEAASRIHLPNWKGGPNAGILVELVRMGWRKSEADMLEQVPMAPDETPSTTVATGETALHLAALDAEVKGLKELLAEVRANRGTAGPNANTLAELIRTGWRELKANMNPNNRNGGTTSLELALAWGFVGIPLLWGIYGTLVNAMKLFQ